LGLHVSTTDESSSGPHNTDPDVQVFNAFNALNIYTSGSVL